MEQSVLNLTRKWRSKKFKEIIGQDLVIKILQNSLYKKTFFPVYLFSGQRGCGKTTTARVFAAAANCKHLEEFQQNPKLYPIPCGSCHSCVAMTHMRHPDFVEIDAASYTGVDNVRNIIDTSSFLPTLSHKKIYLIDEVHMLSKAAFNAFLKILEEPPKFVIFILATTEIHKIPETVKSRCFQLFFNPVQTSVIVQHLQNICDQERITYELSALELIAQACEGSLRDAINLLEQARFAGDSVNKEAIRAALGYLDDQYIYDIVCAILERKEEDLLRSIHKLQNLSLAIDYFVKRLQEFAYDIMLLKYGIKQKFFMEMPDSVKSTLENIDISDVIHCFYELTSLDEVLAKTGKKQLVLETQLLSMVLQHFEKDVSKKKIHETS